MTALESLPLGGALKPCYRGSGKRCVLTHKLARISWRLGTCGGWRLAGRGQSPCVPLGAPCLAEINLWLSAGVLLSRNEGK